MPRVYLHRLRNEAVAAASRLKDCQSLIDRYPGLYVRFRGEQRLFYSKSVNERVTELQFDGHCGHCDHSPLVARVFLYDQETGERVHSDPPTFLISHSPSGNETYGEVPDPLWAERMAAAKISPQIIATIAKFLGQHPPVTEETPVEEQSSTGDVLALLVAASRTESDG